MSSTTIRIIRQQRLKIHDIKFDPTITTGGNLVPDSTHLPVTYANVNHR